MQKWYFHSAIGRGRPLRVSTPPKSQSTLPCHHFNTFSLRQQDAEQDKVMRGKPDLCVNFSYQSDQLYTRVEVTMPISDRAQRLRQSTKEVENLYHRTKGIPATGHRNAEFRSEVGRGAPKSQPAVLKDGDVGVPLTQEVLEGQVPRQRPNSQYPRARKGGIRREGGKSDTRAQGTMRGPGNFTMGRTDAVGRHTVARLEPRRTPTDWDGAVGLPTMRATRANFEGGLGATILNEVPQEYRGDTTGHESKQRFSTQQPTPEHEQYEASRMGPVRDDNGFRGRRPQENSSQQHNGLRVGNDFEARRRGGLNVPSERNPLARRGGVQSGRAGRPRTSRSDGGDQPRRRKRNKEAGSGNDYGGKTSAEETYNEEEKEYAKQKKIREATQSIAYEPGDVNRETFSGLSPAVVSGEYGMSEVLGGGLLLARMYLDGEYVEWHSKEQKADVMTLVERLKNEEQRTPSSSPSLEVEHQTQSLMQKLLGGIYDFTKPQQGKDILGHVARHTDRNESYFPMDQQSLLEKVRSLMPIDDMRKNKKA